MIMSSHFPLAGDFVFVCCDYYLCMMSCTRALRLREPIDAWIRSRKGKYENPIEINHWEYMEALLPVLNLIKTASKYLEATSYPTGSKALKKMWKMNDGLMKVHEAEPAAYTGLGHQTIPSRHPGEVAARSWTTPTLVWQWAFLALMDPSGGIIGGSVGCL